jgi:hypothetical protein
LRVNRFIFVRHVRQRITFVEPPSEVNLLAAIAAKRHGWRSLGGKLPAADGTLE